MNSQPAWLNRNLFPFESKWAEIDGHQLHYIDEGKGEILFMVHGTPEWSFGWRDLIKELRGKYRCIAMDMLGFGLSDKPQLGDYSCIAHARRLEKFINHLQLHNINLIANDFGGGISLDYAIRHPENIHKVILFNTWMWSLKDDTHYSGPAKIMGSWLGKILYLHFNFPVNVIMPSAFGDKKKLTKKIHSHYKNALPSAKDRIAAYAFSKELMNASAWWQTNWEQMGNIANKPFLIFWGMKDKFIPSYELGKWKSKLPAVRIITYQDAGHFVQEEKAEDMSNAIKAFLG